MPALFIFLLRLIRGIRDGLKEPEFRGLFWSVVLILLAGTWFYHTLGLFRLVVIIAQIYIRYARGQTQDERFAAFGPMIPLMAKAAVKVMKE